MDEPAAKPTRGARIVDLVLSLLVLGVLFILSALEVVGLPELTSAERWGYRAGVIIIGVLIGVGARWLYLRRRNAPAPVTRLFSPWLALGAAVIAVQAIGGYTERPPADPTTALRIGSGYVLTRADPELVNEIETQYAARPEFQGRRVEVRQVDGADGSVSFLMIADAAMAPDADYAEVARGMGDAAGVEPELDTIGVQQVAIISVASGSIVTWIESPFVVSVLGADETTARAVAAAVLVMPTT